jgi:hypothetical protein
MWPQGRNIPTGFHRDSSTLPHPALEAGEEALEFAQAARQQIMDMAGLRDARSKVVRRGIGIALDDRDRVDKVAQDPGGTHPC